MSKLWSLEATYPGEILGGQLFLQHNLNLRIVFEYEQSNYINFVVSASSRLNHTPVS
jgi:hypothetical protein